MSFIMSLDIDEFINLINKAFFKREEERAWGMWLMRYQHMDEKSFVPFNEFFQAQKRAVDKTNEQRTAEEILEEVQEIRNRIRKKSGE